MVPTTFLMLPELPLTLNGKVDKRELAKMKGSEVELAGYVAPRTAVELRLAQIWQDTLQCKRVGVTDHFFLDHGGHSLLALTAASRIEKSLGVKVSMGTIIQNPTVEAMAQLIERQGANIANSPLVPIQPKGSKRPFFCIHPGPGSAFCFIELAHLLDRDRPFYGFQSQGINGDQPPLKTIEEMAALYLQEIKKVQPQGPYLLGGYCFGALVVFEIIQRLHSEGEEISAVILIDGEPPLFSQKEREHLLGEASSFSSDLLDMVPAVARIIERHTGRELSFDLQTYTKQPRENQLDYFLQSLRAIGFLPPDADLPHGMGMLRTFKANTDSVLRYVPRSRYMPRLVCFHAVDWNPEDNGREQLDKWSEHFPDQIELIEIPGDHITLMSKPHVEVLAARMMEILKPLN
jgi:thioesterase domain-containing protein/acyl carrier protein